MRLKARIYPIPITYFEKTNKQEWYAKIHKDRFKLDTLVFLYKLLKIWT